MTLRLAHRPPAALLAAAAVATSLASCGGGGGTPVAGGIMLRAATATAAAGTARVSLKEHLDVSGQSIDVRGSGVLDIPGRRARVTLTPVTGGAAAAASASTVITEGLVVYANYKSEQVRQALHIDRPWAKIDLARTAQANGIDPSTAGSSDPANQFELLRGVGKTVQRIGKEKVAGVATTHYRGTIRYDRYAERVAPERRAAARTNARRLEQLTGKSTQEFDIWVDVQGRMRRVVTQLPVKVKTGALAGKTLKQKITTELSAFGVPVVISAPPVSQTFDLTDELVQAVHQVQP